MKKFKLLVEGYRIGDVEYFATDRGVGFNGNLYFKKETIGTVHDRGDGSIVCDVMISDATAKALFTNTAKGYMSLVNASITNDALAITAFTNRLMDIHDFEQMMDEAENKGLFAEESPLCN